MIMDNIQDVSLKTSFFGKQIAPWRVFFFVGSTIFYFPVCVISALTDREYGTFITHMLHIIGQKSTVVAVMALIIIYMLLILSMRSNGVCYPIAAIQILDFLSPQLLKSMAPTYFSSWIPIRLMTESESVLEHQEYYYNFLKFIIPDVLLNYFPRARIGLAYFLIFQAGIYIIPSFMFIMVVTKFIATLGAELQKKLIK